MNWVRHGGSTTFETKSSYYRVARQGLQCYTAVARLGFKRRAKVEFNSINWVRHGSSTTFETGLTWVIHKMIKLKGQVPSCRTADRNLHLVERYLDYNHTKIKINKETLTMPNKYNNSRDRL